MDPTARRTGTARQIRHDPALLPAARPVDIQELDVCDAHLARVRRAGSIVDVEVALVEHDGVVRVLDVDVLVRNVVDEAVADVRAGPSLEARAVLAVEQRDVFEPRVGDVVLDARVLPDAAHADAVGAVAPEVFHKDIGRVRLGREAVVADVDARVGYRETVDVERVEAVCVFGKGLVGGR